ncbi:phage/plasmid primase, P4 family [Sinirhodobacter sp. HNIBRBA609]|nr:phage/plasmid primase, P4 family [Sinirhodobacter sp. HNIBRBA609]
MNRPLPSTNNLAPEAHASCPENPASTRAQLDGLPPALALSEDALAARFVALNGGCWRHVPAWRSWFHWNGKVWAKDEKGSVREAMRLICRDAAKHATTGEARRVASDKTITAALKIAGTDPRLAVAVSAWDTHPMLLNTQNGVIDLETGEQSPHDPNLLLTQITPVPVGNRCSRWLAFMEEITGGDRELQGYLQRLAGYSVTGRTSEQAFAFLYGQGANGKSVFLSTLAHVLGSYAATATLDTFSATRTSRHLTELAGLRAARLVLVPETEDGQGWAEARIKSVTGGEKVRANFMHQDHFEFLPQFTLIVAGNHRPSVKNVGEAMRRRLHLVPFTVTIPPDRRDHGLAEKLRAEADGILGWMIEGAAEWQNRGLAAPAGVLDAAQEYFASEDLMGQWIDECCEQGARFWEAAAILFQSWKAWNEERGFAYGNSRSLGEALRARGFSPQKQRQARGWSGLAIRKAPIDGEDGK